MAKRPSGNAPVPSGSKARTTSPMVDFETPSCRRWSRTSLVATAPFPSALRALSTAPKRQEGPLLSSDTTKFVAYWQSLARACRRMMEPSTSTGCKRVAALSSWDAENHGCCKHPAAFGRSLTSGSSIWAHKDEAPDEACRNNKVARSGSPRAGANSRSSPTSGSRDSLKSSPAEGCLPTRSMKSMQPHDQTSRFGLVASLRTLTDGTSAAIESSGDDCDRARGGGSGNNPARPKSVSMTCGAALMSQTDASETLSRFRSPCTMPCGRSSWQWRKASKIWRMTSANHLSLMRRAALYCCRKKPTSSTPSTVSVTTYTLWKSSKFSTTCGKLTCSMFRRSSTSARKWSAGVTTLSLRI
mmetsp:Transcript_79644/g.221617  ORF Transcript_79644/g.221617 Transcript_79644/m.221617 type:complete len:357 (-) Transcript_79644:1411-2481(-)